MNYFLKNPAFLMFGKLITDKLANMLCVSRRDLF